MFKNPEIKLEAVVKVFTVILMIGTVIGGVCMLLSGEDDLSFLGILLVLASPLVLWILSLPVLAFCNLCKNTAEIREMIGYNNTAMPVQNNFVMPRTQMRAPIEMPKPVTDKMVVSTEKQEEVGGWYCGKCGHHNSDEILFCSECGLTKNK